MAVSESGIIYDVPNVEIPVQNLTLIFFLGDD